MANFGKINLTAFKNASIKKIGEKRGVFIPIEDNFLFEAENSQVYIDIVNFEVDNLKPFTHRIIRSVPEQFREE